MMCDGMMCLNAAVTATEETKGNEQLGCHLRMQPFNRSKIINKVFTRGLSKINFCNGKQLKS